MRAFILVAAIFWAGFSWWWYVCDIKGYCETTNTQVAQTETDANNKDNESTEESLTTAAKTELAEENQQASQSSVTAENTNNDAENSQTQNNDGQTVTTNTNNNVIDVVSNQSKTNMDANSANNRSDIMGSASENNQGDIMQAGNADNNSLESHQMDSMQVNIKSDNDRINLIEGDTAANVEDNNISDTENYMDEQQVTDNTDDNDPNKIRIDGLSDSNASDGKIEKIRIYFPYSSSRQTELTSSADQYFDKIVAALKTNETLVIKLTGHTDNRGKASRNKILGLRRAETIKKILVKKGAPADRVKTESMGESQPFWSNASKAGREKNRRVELEVVTE